MGESICAQKLLNSVAASRCVQQAIYTHMQLTGWCCARSANALSAAI